MMRLTEAADEQGPTLPNIARIDDYWLGGEHHGERDRDFADRTATCAPHIPYLVRAQRALLGRMVRYLARQGVRQFLDLGSGLPTMGHIHETARDIDPASRVVYVDRDPGVAAECRELLNGDQHAVLLQSDIREPAVIVETVRTLDLLDLSEPVAVLVIATLQHIPDTDQPADMIAAYMNATCPGSYLAMSHYGPDTQLSAAYRIFDQMQLGRRPDVNLRDRTSLARFFAGLELVEPGIVPIVAWRPDPDDDLGHHWERMPINAGLGRKP
ncbi:MAG TPA: SAM-dependent methyltransferase [Pseudonocardiaceae bacterium]|nr:SAM-dependent methyltransferase [Pseudonocardiaceae bacterium]